MDTVICQNGCRICYNWRQGDGDFLVDVREAHVGIAPEVDIASSHFLLDRGVTHAVINIHILVAYSQLGPDYRHRRLTDVGVTEQREVWA